MGVFDSFFIACPKCGKDLEFQSKSGPCALENYKYKCPVEVAIGINGDIVNCEFCGCNWKINFNLPKMIIPTLSRTSFPKDYSGNYNLALPENKKKIEDLKKRLTVKGY